MCVTLSHTVVLLHSIGCLLLSTIQTVGVESSGTRGVRNGTQRPQDFLWTGLFHFQLEGGVLPLAQQEDLLTRDIWTPVQLGFWDTCPFGTFLERSQLVETSHRFCSWLRLGTGTFGLLVLLSHS